MIPTRVTTALAGRYLLEREIGRGGMATVYLARDVKHDRRVAIKVLRPEVASTMGAGRFIREITITARLQHPHILTLIDSGEIASDGPGTDRVPYYVMPFVDGESLRDRLARHGTLPVAEAVQVLRGVVDALACAHEDGIVHRDIKPENVLLTGHHALVVDFGVAKAMLQARQEGALTGTGNAVGTPAYMAPEQVAADPLADHRTDVYAVGVLAYEMLTGYPPFTGTSRQVLAAQLTTPPASLGGLRADTPPELERIVARCLEKDPALRYQSAEALLAELEALSAPASRASTTEPTDSTATTGARGRWRGRSWIAASAAGLVAIAALGMMVAHVRRERWVHEYAIPAIQRLSDAWESDSAFEIAERASAILPGDSVLESLWPRFSRTYEFVSHPPGATVYRASFDDTTRWSRLGVTPTGPMRLPSAFARFRFERPGYRPATVLAGGFIPGAMANTGAALPPYVPLLAVTSPDSGMVMVAGGTMGGGLPGLDYLDQVELGDFLVDRYEVTNRQYRAFVDAGGYRRRDLWTEPFMDGDRTLEWEEAMLRFTDRTGRPGPATWEAGVPTAGTEDLPVGGISWYEAAAYASFVGKSLPTIYHWSNAAAVTAAAWIMPRSNFASDAPRRGGVSGAMSPWGAFDMAGNVREWCLNADDQGWRYILGGGWSDPAYMFTDPYAQPPFDRSVANGVRLVRHPAREPHLAAAAGPIRTTYRDYHRETPAPDAVYASYREMYDYDRTPLAARLETRDTTPADWVREIVSFDAAYGGERMTAVVFIPKRHPSPHQAVVVFPGGNALIERSSSRVDGQPFEYLMRSGRVAVLPIFKGTYDRGEGADPGVTNETVAYRDLVVMMGKDLRRTVDYLGTRADIDSTRLAFLGISWGGRMGGLMVAIEPRFRAAVFSVGGLGMSRPRPEADPLNFLPRVHVPSLMLNGKYDHIFPTETSQRPFFELLGVPPSLKRRVLYEGGHALPRTLVAKETLDWLDRYLGPVTR